MKTRRKLSQIPALFYPAFLLKYYYLSPLVGDLTPMKEAQRATLTELGAHFRAHKRASLGSVFKTETGSSPHEYLSALRLRRALRLSETPLIHVHPARRTFPVRQKERCSLPVPITVLGNSALSHSGILNHLFPDQQRFSSHFFRLFHPHHLNQCRCRHPPSLRP